MNITIVYDGVIPVNLYGGTQRVIWYLGHELSKLGHKVTFLVEEKSFCSFASVIFMDKEQDIWNQIPKDTDVVHFHQTPPKQTNTSFPYVVTMHGNSNASLDKNTIFVSKNHAQRYNSYSYVHNGLDWNDYMKPDFNKKNYFHFLGKAAWRIKNVKGAINVVKKTKTEYLKVMGGKRLNLTMGFRFTLTHRASFYGMVGGKQKHDLLNHSKGLIFPVLWHEPFGLAITESLFYGCPVFGTPYGSLPELVNTEVGFLSNKREELTNAIENISDFSNQKCHEYALEYFNSKKMAISYIDKYEHVLNNHYLNDSHPKLKNNQTEKFLDWFE